MKLRILLAVYLLTVATMAQGATLKLYMSTTGSDTLGGTTEVTAVKTLGRIQNILVATQPTGPVEVHIAPGTYLGQTVVWTYFNGQAITFTPLDFGTVAPIFDGQGTAGEWFRMESSSGKNTYLKFRYLRVQNYTAAISFVGDRENELYGWNGGNELYGMYFYHIGNKWSTNALNSTGAVHFVNSRDNSVANSHFINIENIASVAAIHALYIAHYSSGNSVERNKFSYVSGDPVKVRDSSNNNYVADNEFNRSGNTAYFLDSFCDSARTDCTKMGPECPSLNNAFSANTLQRGYSGALISESTTTGPVDDCPRIISSGNTQS
jgi:hypothetical protein